MKTRPILALLGALAAARGSPQAGAGATEKHYPAVVLKNVEQVCLQVDKAAWKAYQQPRGPVCIRLVCLKAKGIEDFDYDDLQAIWGWGTVFAYHPLKYQVMYRPPKGFDKRLSRATGFEWTFTRLQSGDRAWDILTKSIDAGNPLEGTYWEHLVFAGYQAATKKAGRRVFVLRDPLTDGKGRWWTWERFGKWAGGNAFSYQVRKVDKAPAREIALDLMKAAVRDAENDPRAKDKGFADATLGLAGMEAYAADVANPAKTPGDFYPGWLGCHCVYRQFNARKSMAIYLKRVARHFAEKARAHILAAAAKYDAAYAAWQDYAKHLAGKDRAVAQRKWKKAASRKAGAAAVRRAAEHERAAVAELKKALAALEP